MKRTHKLYLTLAPRPSASPNAEIIYITNSTSTECPMNSWKSKLQERQPPYADELLTPSVQTPEPSNSPELSEHPQHKFLQLPHKA